jgi:hypothetical protein
MDSVVAPHVIYQTHMAEAKVRILAAERILNSPMTFSEHRNLDLEFCFLQIRRIIEAVTFGAMIREEQRYTKLRGLQREANARDHGNSSKDWQAPEILKRLVSLSPHALPRPLSKPTRHSSGLVEFQNQNITVNHDRLIALYGRSGGYLHAKNPLSADFSMLVEVERKKYNQAPAEATEALDFLRKLLWNHAAITLDWTDLDDPMSLDNPRLAWIVDFGPDEGHDVSLILASAVIG